MGTIICANCHTENPDSNIFCQGCGQSLKRSYAPASDQTVAAPRGVPAEPPIPPVPPVVAPPPATAVPAPIKTSATPPVKPAAAVPPPPPPAPRVVVQATPISKLGVYTDGWSDVIEGGAPLADKVKREFVNNLKAAEIPGLHVAESMLMDKNGEIRPSEVINFGRDMTIIARTGAFGKHLTVSWDLYTKQTINWLTVGILGGAVFVLAFLTHILGGIFYNGFFYGLFNWLGTFINWLLVPGLALMLVGKITHGDWLALYKKDQGEFAEDDAMALTNIVDIALSDAIEKALESE